MRKPSSAKEHDIAHIEPTIFSPKGQQPVAANLFQPQNASQPYYSPSQPMPTQAAIPIQQQQPVPPTALNQRNIPPSQFASIASVVQSSTPQLQQNVPVQQVRPIVASPTAAAQNQIRPPTIPNTIAGNNYSEYERTMVNRYMNNMNPTMLMQPQVARTITPNAAAPCKLIRYGLTLKF